MKGYIVGYLDDWGNDRRPLIIGYYTSWSCALDNAKKLERTNLDYRKGLIKVYIVEIEVNKTYPTQRLNWIENYPHFYIVTNKEKTILQSSEEETIEIELPPAVVKEQRYRPQRNKNKRLARRPKK